VSVPGSIYEPLTIESDYPPPPAAIHPDRSKGWVARLGPLLRNHLGVIVASTVAALLAMFSQILVPQVIRLAIDDALIEQTGSLTPYVIVAVCLGLTRGLFTFLYRYGLYGMAFKMEFHLRTLLFNHLGRLSFSFFDRVQSGQIISRANSDIRSVQMFLAFAPIMAVQFLSFIVAIVLMVRIDPVLTAITMVALPGVFVLGQQLRVVMFPLSWLQQSRMAEVATVVDETVSGVRVVKAFAAEKAQIDKLAAAATRLRWANVFGHNTRAKVTPFIENLPRLALALVLLYGGLQAIEGQLTIGDLLAFNLYIVLLQAPFRFIGMLLILGQRARASAQRIFEILDETPSVQEQPGAVDLVDAKGQVTFDEVSFAYGTETVGGADGNEDAPAVLDHLSLTIAAGETVALVGRTGSGKSTIPRLLLRFYDPREGSIRIDGQDLQQLTVPSLRHAVSLVPDEPFLFSCSVHDNIAYGRPDASRVEVEDAARHAQAHDFISNLGQGFDTVVGERGYDLSGGQRQRIALARAFLADPAVLILDDATSAIDVQIEEDIHDALHEMMRGRTTIIIAHRLSTISLAERVLFLADGKVAAEGTHAELLATEPRYVEALASADSSAASQESLDPTPSGDR
jgi:ATP-binding cassette subfamily B protein